jgi:phenylpropionate dioxygenase-like ring-hydroxylating dioxygenase large terminal subunit
MNDVNVLDIRESLDQGFTLPATWYWDPDIYALEQERIFRRSWQYAGVAARIPSPGDYFTFRIADVPVVVLRDHLGQVRAFVNVCRHRGNEVVQGSGHRETLQCPYHAWTYDLDGGLRAAPRSDREPNFDRTELSLVPASIEQWQQFLFVNLDQDAAPLADGITDLSNLVVRTGLDLSALHLFKRTEFVVEANWKATAENFLECYHCAVVHPSFSALIDVGPDGFWSQACDQALMQVGRLRASTVGGTTRPYDATGQVTELHSHLIWPNFAINFPPGPPSMSALSMTPIDSERTLFIMEYYFEQGIDEGQALGMVAWAEEVGQEDFAILMTLQRGLRSRTVDRGRLLLESEGLIHHFQKLVCAALS